MEQGEIIKRLQENGYYKSGDRTYPHSYNCITVSSLELSQMSNRDSTSWKKAAVVIATSDKPIPVPTTYIDGWKQVAKKYGDQLLLLEVDKGVFAVYDSKGACLGKGDAFIAGMFKKSAIVGDLTPVILYGAPGTGKTYHLQTHIYDHYDPEDRFFTTFHQSYCYEYFVEGLKPILDRTEDTDTGNVQYTIDKGVFVKACERAAFLAGYENLKECLADTRENRKLKFEEAVATGRTVLLCIDEINRANISSVFGDTIPLIEKSKRLGAANELTSILTYSGEEFGVPLNLYIVGAMNTADRSIQLIDSALRRRFRFKPFTPDYNAILTNGIKESADVLKAINSRIRRILDKDHEIGHSYFIGVTDLVGIVKTIRDNIIPLLEEYCYNQTENIKKILGEEYDEVFYIRDTECMSASEDDDETVIYTINPELELVETEEQAKEFLRKLLPTV